MDSTTIEMMEADYKQGFNEGYTIAKYSPDLADSLAQVKNEGPRMEGFRNGRDEWIQEKIKQPEHLPNSTKQAPEKDHREIDLDKE